MCLLWVFLCCDLNSQLQIFLCLVLLVVIVLLKVVCGCFCRQLSSYSFSGCMWVMQFWLLRLNLFGLQCLYNLVVCLFVRLLWGRCLWRKVLKFVRLVCGCRQWWIVVSCIGQGCRLLRKVFRCWLVFLLWYLIQKWCRQIWFFLLMKWLRQLVWCGFLLLVSNCILFLVFWQILWWIRLCSRCMKGRLIDLCRVFSSIGWWLLFFLWKLLKVCSLLLVKKFLQGLVEQCCFMVVWSIVERLWLWLVIRQLMFQWRMKLSGFIFILCSLVMFMLLQLWWICVMVFRQLVSICSLVVEFNFSLLFLLMLKGWLVLLVCICIWLLFGVCLNRVKLQCIEWVEVGVSRCLLISLSWVVQFGLVSFCKQVVMFFCNLCWRVVLVCRLRWLRLYSGMLSILVRWV